LGEEQEQELAPDEELGEEPALAQVPVVELVVALVVERVVERVVEQVLVQAQVVELDVEPVLPQVPDGELDEEPVLAPALGEVLAAWEMALDEDVGPALVLELALELDGSSYSNRSLTIFLSPTTRMISLSLTTFLNLTRRMISLRNLFSSSCCCFSWKE
jgi:hypothetical protein